MTDSTLQQLLVEIQALQKQPVLRGAERMKLWKNAVKLAAAPYPFGPAVVAACLQEMQQALSEAQAARGNPALTDAFRFRIFRNLHELAEAQYQPALEFLMVCLDHPDATWRWHSLRDIGFHYATSPDSLFVEKARELLYHDPDSNVRKTAALILGIRSQWEDTALVTALRSDPEWDIRAAAFASLLQLAGVPRQRAWKFWQQVKNGEIQPIWEEVKRIVVQEGIDLNGTQLGNKLEAETQVNW